MGFMPCVKCGGITYTDHPRCKYCWPCKLQAHVESNRKCPSQTPERQANRNGEHYRRVVRKRYAVLGEPQRCEVCGQRFKEMTVDKTASPTFDHHHDTGEARGWLCSRCNSGLGFLGDNPRIIRAAADYLERRGCYVSRSLLR